MQNLLTKNGNSPFIAFSPPIILAVLLAGLPHLLLPKMK